MIIPLPLVLTVILTFAGFAAATDSAQADWPQWRGPLANGVSPDADPPVEWCETKNLKWKVSIPGLGSSTPIILGDQVFITTAVPTGKKDTTPAAEAELKQAGPGSPPPGPPPGGRDGERRDRRRESSPGASPPGGGGGGPAPE